MQSALITLVERKRARARKRRGAGKEGQIQILRVVESSLCL